MNEKLKAGIVGATGMVGQRFVTLLADHPWFEVALVAASGRSAGKSYAEAVEGRWSMPSKIPQAVAGLTVMDGSRVAEVAAGVDVVFCAVDMPKQQIRELEEQYARHETPVISNNSAHRMTPDVPVVVPEINPEHFAAIEQQRHRLGVSNGFIAVKPNCSIQSYVPALHPLREFGLQDVIVSTYQAISGAGKTFSQWPEMEDNVIPFIGGEEEKSEVEPLKIWGRLNGSGIELAELPTISSHCIRVPVTDGHLATVNVRFDRTPSRDEVLARWREFRGRPQELQLPSAPAHFLVYYDEEDHPQTRLQRDEGNGMAVTLGRLRDDRIFDYRFVCLSHNTIRGAAGGGVLMAEMLKHDGYLTAK